MINHIGTNSIETIRLILRRFKEEDTYDMHKNWASDKESLKFLSWGPYSDMGVTKGRIGTWIRQYDDKKVYNWAIYLKSIKEVIGQISVEISSDKEKSCEIGYCIGKEFWGREIVLDFVGGSRDYHTVVFLKNTTECINKLSYRLKDTLGDKVVLTTYMEHHSNFLPWKYRYKTDLIEVDNQGRLCLEDLEFKLRLYNGKVGLVAVTGASNVTGYINPIYEIASICHKYGAKILVDGAQLIPHSRFNMMPVTSPYHIDYLAFSAHKMYAPFGIGALVCPKEIFEQGYSEQIGGGTVKFVSTKDVIWLDPPEEKMFSNMSPKHIEDLPLSKMNFAGIGKKMLVGMMEDTDTPKLSDFLNGALNKGVSMKACKLSCEVMGFGEEELLKEVTIVTAEDYLVDALNSDIQLFI